MHNQNRTIFWEVATLRTVWILIFVGDIDLIDPPQRLKHQDRLPVPLLADAFLS